MALELYYTSSPRGLRPGTSGLCTVAMTRSMSVALASRLESLCGYRPPGEDVPIDRWPAALSHWIVDIGGVERHVLAAVRPVRPDHTMRSNTLAHFAVLHTSELDPAGAAWMLAQPETSASSWSGEPRLLDAERAMPRGGPSGARACTTWKSVAGDAGWAGALANAAMLDPTRPATVIYPAGARPLDLIAEAMSLLPAAYRWKVTFTTYFTQPIAGLRCTWRFCLEGTSAATAARQSGGLVIDASAPNPCTRTGEFVDAAREGRDPVLASSSAPVAAKRPAGSTRAASAPGEAGAIPFEHDTANDGTGRRGPSRRPVGIDEPDPAVATGGRAALAMAVVTAIILLAIVAVLAVLMRTMSAEIAELQGRVAKAEEERESFRASAEASDSLRAQRDELNAQREGTNNELKALRDAQLESHKEIVELQAKLKQLTPAEASGPAAPQSTRADPKGPASPAPAAPPSGQETVPESGASAQSQGDSGQPHAGAGPTATSRGASTVIRRVDAVQQQLGVSSGATIESIGAPSAPPLLTPGAATRAAVLPWAACASCDAPTVALQISSALESIGFTVTDGATLAFREGGGAQQQRVATASAVASGLEWTWDESGASRADRSFGKLGLRSPGAWTLITGQVQARLSCGDGTMHEASLGIPSERTWPVTGRGGDRIEVSLPRALSTDVAVEWGGRALTVGESGTTIDSSAGTVNARRVSASGADTATIELKWTPATDGQRAIECSKEFEAQVAKERRLTALQGHVSQWIQALTVPKAIAPAQGAQDLVTAGYNAWRAKEDAKLSPADKTKYDAKPLAKRLEEYKDALVDLEIQLLRDELAHARSECDSQRQAWRAHVVGATVAVRPNTDSPPIELVKLSMDLKPLTLPWTTGGAAGGTRP